MVVTDLLRFLAPSVTAKLKELEYARVLARSELDEKTLIDLADFFPSEACAILRGFESLEYTNPSSSSRAKNKQLKKCMSTYRKDNPNGNGMLANEVVDKLSSLLSSGTIMQGDLDGTCIETLESLPIENALQLLQEFGSSFVREYGNAATTFMDIYAMLRPHIKGSNRNTTIPELKDHVMTNRAFRIGSDITASQTHVQKDHGSGHPHQISSLDTSGPYPNFDHNYEQRAIVPSEGLQSSRVIAHPQLVTASGTILPYLGDEQRSAGVRIEEFHALSNLAPYVHPLVARCLQDLWDVGQKLVSFLDDSCWEALLSLNKRDAIDLIESVQADLNGSESAVYVCALFQECARAFLLDAAANEPKQGANSLFGPPALHSLDTQHNRWLNDSGYGQSHATMEPGTYATNAPTGENQAAAWYDTQLGYTRDQLYQQASAGALDVGVSYPEYKSGSRETISRDGEGKGQMSVLSDEQGHDGRGQVGDDGIRFTVRHRMDLPKKVVSSAAAGAAAAVMTKSTSAPTAEVRYDGKHSRDVSSMGLNMQMPTEYRLVQTTAAGGVSAGLEGYASQPPSSALYTSHPTILGGYSSQPPNSMAYTRQLPNTALYTSQPTTLGSYTSQSSNPEGYTSQPPNPVGYTSQPPNSVVYTSQPPNAVGYTSQPPNSVGYTSQPQNPVGYTSQPPSTVGYTSQPPNAVGYTSQPPNAVGYTSQPPNSVGYTSQPPNAVRYTSQPPDPVGYTSQLPNQMNNTSQPSNPMGYTSQPPNSAVYTSQPPYLMGYSSQPPKMVNYASQPTAAQILHNHVKAPSVTTRAPAAVTSPSVAVPRQHMNVAVAHKRDANAPSRLMTNTQPGAAYDDADQSTEESEELYMGHATWNTQNDEERKATYVPATKERPSKHVGVRVAAAGTADPARQSGSRSRSQTHKQPANPAPATGTSTRPPQHGGKYPMSPSKDQEQKAFPEGKRRAGQVSQVIPSPLQDRLTRKGQPSAEMNSERRHTQYSAQVAGTSAPRPHTPMTREKQQSADTRTGWRVAESGLPAAKQDEGPRNMQTAARRTREPIVFDPEQAKAQGPLLQKSHTQTPAGGTGAGATRSSARDAIREAIKLTAQKAHHSSNLQPQGTSTEDAPYAFLDAVEILPDMSDLPLESFLAVEIPSKGSRKITSQLSRLVDLDRLQHFQLSYRDGGSVHMLVAQTSESGEELPVDAEIYSVIEEHCLETYTVDLPARMPSTSEVWEQWTEVWPLQSQVFPGARPLVIHAVSKATQDYFKKNMACLLKYAERMGDSAAAMVVDASDGLMLGRAGMCKKNHPLKHCVMSALQSAALVASTREGERLRKRRKTEAKDVDEETAAASLSETMLDCFVIQEPCLMCSMALINSQVTRVIYCVPDPVNGALGSRYCLQASEHISPEFAVYQLSQSLS